MGKKVLVVGASGATGKLLVSQLLKAGHQVNAIVRTPEKFSNDLKKNEKLNLIKANLLELSDKELQNYTFNCDAVAFCLGHNLNWKGIYGHPRRLVTDATKRLTKAMIENNPQKKVRYILMNTTGNRNRDLNEPVPTAQKLIIGILRLLLPPHVDNENAADFLRTQIGQDNPVLEWSAVRPDTLIDDDQVTKYEIHPSPTRSALFNPGKTSRINVAHFMKELSVKDDLWEDWKGKMPVIYNREH